MRQFENFRTPGDEVLVRHSDRMDAPSLVLPSR
jgi:hypothetical protein